MKYILVACAITLLLIGCQASVSMQYPKGNSVTNVHAKGDAYFHGCKAALQDSLLACEWPDDYPGINDDGAAYKEGAAAAEDADCHEDKDAYLAYEWIDFTDSDDPMDYIFPENWQDEDDE